MKRIFIISLIALALAAGVPTAHAQIPFGGLAVPISPCNNGFLYLVAPYGLFMFTRPPAGTFVLGMAAAAPVPCILTIVPIGVGFPVIIFGP